MFAFSPFDCIDVTTYYGGSLPLALGGQMAGRRAAWAVTGDYSFLAAGHLGLVEAVARQLPIKVLIIQNGCAKTTGGQPIPPGLLERVLDGFRSHIRIIENPFDPESARAVLSDAADSARLQIVLARYAKTSG